MPVKIVLPDIPVGLNGRKGLLRMHWRARSNHNHYWAQLVRAAIPEPQTPPAGRQEVLIVQFRPRRLDPDNLHASCKPILDALVTWGLLADDSEKHINLRPIQCAGRRDKHTVVLIEPELAK